MSTMENALLKVDEILAEREATIGIDLAVNRRAVRDEEWCWVVPYNSRAYIETGSFSHTLAGNGPFVVDKETGVVHELISARPIDVQLDELRQAR
jgi:hypothetical protein